MNWHISHRVLFFCMKADTTGIDLILLYLTVTRLSSVSSATVKNRGTAIVTIAVPPYYDMLAQHILALGSQVRAGRIGRDVDVAPCIRWDYAQSVLGETLDAGFLQDVDFLLFHREPGDVVDQLLLD